jgi:hypothetical protein
MNVEDSFNLCVQHYMHLQKEFHENENSYIFFFKKA